MLQAKLHRHENPDGHGLATAACWFKTPALHRLGRRFVEIRMPGGLLDLDGLHPAPLCDPHLEQDCAFDASASGKFRIAGFDLVAT